jgi:hypothetical protein
MIASRRSAERTARLDGVLAFAAPEGDEAARTALCALAGDPIRSFGKPDFGFFINFNMTD